MSPELCPGIPRPAKRCLSPLESAALEEPRRLLTCGAEELSALSP